MIGFLQGSVLYKTENTIIVENAGIGYEVHVSEDTFLCLHESDTVQLYIYHHITENGQSLYGFKNMNERRFFMLLISVSGIGPKSALSMMQVPMDTTLKALSQGNTMALTELPGVGKKTAERMVLELKNKVSGILFHQSKVQEIFIDVSHPSYSDATAALVSLGYSRFEASDMLGQIPEDITSTQDIIKYALQHKA